MIREQLLESQLNKLEYNIRNKLYVSRWEVYSRRFELRERLKDSEEFTDYIEMLIDSVRDSL